MTHTEGWVIWNTVVIKEDGSSRKNNLLHYVFLSIERGENDQNTLQT